MKITLLEKNDILLSNALKVLAHPKIDSVYAIQATDFAVLTGVKLDSNSSNNKQCADLVWTKSSCERRVEYDYGFQNYDVVMDISDRNKAMWANSREACILPVISLDEAKKERDYKIIGEVVVEPNTSIPIVQVGSYPQSLADIKTSAQLSRALARNQLTETGHTYTINTLEMCPYSKDTRTQCFGSLKEYEFEGEKYVQVVATLAQNSDETKHKIHLEASDRIIKNKKSYWVKVEPLTWVADEQNGILISKKGILSGIRFDNSGIYNGKYEQTEMNAFCCNYLSNEINNREQISLNNFKSFAMAQLKNKVVSMQRIQYFQQLLIEAKAYLDKSITGQNLSDTEKEIVNYTKQHIQDMTKRPDETPKSMLQEFCKKPAEQIKQHNSNISFISRLRNLFIRD